MKDRMAMDMVSEARQKIENLTPAQVLDEVAAGYAVLIDIREKEELVQQGHIEGAVHASRGMLEFYADPTLPYHKPAFQKDKRIILQCASGGRSALATQTLHVMGYKNVAHLDGGLKAWKEAGLPVKQ